MKKLHFKTEGSEPDVDCVEPCTFKNKPSKGTMIGSANCQQCSSCYGWDSEENWVKCLDYAISLINDKEN